MTAPAVPLWPSELRVKQGGLVLEISFETGLRHELTAEYLRVESPSAEVKGHSASQRKLVSGVADVRIKAVEPVGNYAVRLVFDDGHDTGLYSWAYLHELGREHATRWQAYLDELASAGKSRTR